MTFIPQIIHHGGREGVTGSCHELRVGPDAGILIDCGLFQGDELRQDRESRSEDRGSGLSAEESNSRLSIDFPIGHIKALVVTHAHIDHAGRIPWLLAAGFKGPIFCSEPSALLLPLMLEDAFKVGVSRDTRLAEKYLKELTGRLSPIAYGRWQAIPAGPCIEMNIKLQPAGHILGSAYVTVQVLSSENQSPSTKNSKPKTKNLEKTIVFSGDLGAPYAPLLPAPKSPYKADVLVLESTYGDRLHEGRRDRRARLKTIIENALADRGAVLIPSFALGRTQELLYELEGIIHAGRKELAAENLPWEDLEIIVDSPLADRITGAFRRLRPYWDREALRLVRSGRNPMAFEQMTVIKSHADHENAVHHLQKHGRPCLVIAAGGMCSGGRIVNYLKALIGDPRTDVVFVGYQAQGSPGRTIQEYGPRGGYVVLDGQRYDIRARIHTLDGYSAHADRKNLVDFVRRMRHKPAEIRLVHGDRPAREALAALLRSDGYVVV
jgi:metallo-beta-lactamase family protein